MSYILPLASSRNNNDNTARHLRAATSDQGPISCVCLRNVQQTMVAAAFAALMERLIVSGNSALVKTTGGRETPKGFA
jgi:hypothetical protein